MARTPAPGPSGWVQTAASVLTSRGAGTQGDAVGGPFISDDPLVGDLANEIEAALPGSVRGVNVPIYDTDGNKVTDADISLDVAIIQVKSGGGKKPTGQVVRTHKATAMRVIAYGPDLKGSVVRGIRDRGFEVYEDAASLIEALRSGM